jgi:transcriptional regulator with XRE-family HTH domain
MADRIRYVRDFVLLLTQEELAEKLGVSRGSVGNWELGGGIGRKNLVILARMAGCTMEWIESGKGEPPAERQRLSIVKAQTVRAEPATGADEDRESALIQGLIAAFCVQGVHAAELETLLRRVLSEQSSGRNRDETLASRRDLVRYVVREFLHSKGLKDGEG